MVAGTLVAAGLPDVGPAVASGSDVGIAVAAVPPQAASRIMNKLTPKEGSRRPIGFPMKNVHSGLIYKVPFLYQYMMGRITF